MEKGAVKLVCGFCYAKDVICMCKECSFHFCENCLTIHKRIVMFEGHNIQKLCPLHPEQCLNYICTECLVFLCDKCLDLEEHLNHEDEVLALKPGLLTLQSNIRQCHNKCEANRIKLEKDRYKRLKCIERNKTKRKHLVKEKEKLLKSLEKISKEIKVLNKQNDQLQVKVQKAEEIKKCYVKLEGKLDDVKNNVLMENIDKYTEDMGGIKESMRDCDRNFSKISPRKVLTILKKEESDDQISATTEQKTESSETDNGNLPSAKRMKIDIQLNNIINPLAIKAYHRKHKDPQINKETSTQTNECQNENLTVPAEVSREKSSKVEIQASSNEKPEVKGTEGDSTISGNDSEPSGNQPSFKIKTEVSEDNSQTDIYHGSLKEPVGLACGQENIFVADSNKTEILQINWLTKNVSSVNLKEPILSLDTFHSFLYILHMEIIAKRSQQNPKEIHEIYSPRISDMSAINVVDENLILVSTVNSCIYEFHVKTDKARRVLKINDEMLYMCVDPDKKKYYVTLCTQHKVHVYNYKWELVTSFGGYGSQDAHLQLPRDIAVTPAGVAVADWNNRRVSLFTVEGTFVKQLLDSSNNIKQPWRLAYKDDRLWVLDLTIGYTPSIRRFKLSAIQ